MRIIQRQQRQQQQRKRVIRLFDWAYRLGKHRWVSCIFILFVSVFFLFGFSVFLDVAYFIAVAVISQ